MRFIGVDPSVTGFASIILDENNNVLQEITLKGKKEIGRASCRERV